MRIRPALRHDLVGHKLAAQHDRPTAPVFATLEGKAQTVGNVRSRVVARAVTRASDRLEAEGGTPLPTITPHGLRRTFASILYAIGEPPPVVMQEMGHTDPALALAIYAHAMRRDEGENEAIRSLVNGHQWALDGVQGAADEGDVVRTAA